MTGAPLRGSLAPGLALILAFAGGAALAALDVPALERRVTDSAEIIPKDTEEELESRLGTLEQTSGAQIAVLTLPTLEGESIESFSLRVARSWALGRAGADDGVLFLVAMSERSARLEVGAGLEQRLTEREAERILREVMVPYFRAGRHGEGIRAVVEAVIPEITDGAATAEALPATAREPASPPPPPGALGPLTSLRSLRLPGQRYLWLGGVAAVSALVATLFSLGPSIAFLVLMLAPETGWAWAVAVAAGIGLANLFRGFGWPSFRPGRWQSGADRGGWSSRGGGSSWGGGGGGGGFGGGGGSFRGGGASSRW